MVKRLFQRLFPILDRYLITQFTGPFLLAVGGFAIIGIIDILFYLVELAVISGVSISVTVRLLVYKLPAIMILFFPMAVLFSVMLLLIRMAKDNELTILRASGIATSRILTPIIILAVLTALISFYVNEKIVPWTNRTSETLIRKEIRKKAPPDVTDNVIFKDQDGRFFYIRKVNSKLSELSNVLILDPTSSFPRHITAKKGYWDDYSWTLVDGNIQEFNSDGLVEFSDSFGELTIHVDEDLASQFTRQKTTKEMDSKELKGKIKTLNKGGISTRALRVEYHLKKSIPAACFIFGLIGIAFSISLVKTGKDWWGVILAICISVLTVGFYFFILALSRAMAKDGHLTAVMGAWAPNILYGTIASLTIAYHALRK